MNINYELIDTTAPAPEKGTGETAVFYCKV